MKSLTSSEQGLLHTRLGLDGLWHAVYEMSCGNLHSLASHPDEATAMEEGRQKVVDAIWPTLHPYQREMICAMMKAKDEGRELLVMPGKRYGRATIARTYNLLRNPSASLAQGKLPGVQMLLVDDMEEAP